MTQDKSVAVVILRLHQGLGVRESNLAATLADTVVAQRWQITGNDHLIIVRAKVIYRLEVAFAGLASPERDVWPVLYNAHRDTATHDLGLGERKRRLPTLFPTLPVKGRSADRCISVLSDQLTTHTANARHEEFDQVRLATLVREEEDLAASVKLTGRAGEFQRLVSAAYESPVRPAQLAFLDQRLVTPLSITGGLVVARTGLGDWVCAFSDVDALHAFQDATPQQNRGHVRELTGADLVRDVSGRPQPIGIVVNPSPTRSNAPGWTARRTLPLTPADVAKLAADLAR